MDKPITTECKILAQIMNNLSPGVSVEDWQKHIMETGANPQAFFGKNGVGYSEYQTFVAKYEGETRQILANFRRM